MLDRLDFYIGIIKESELFQKDLYLCSCFAIDDTWQVDFYSKKAKAITSFVVNNKKAEILNENSKIFQKENVDLEELNLEEVKIDLPEAQKILETAKQQLCPGDKIARTITILQKIKVPIWNLTYLTNNFNVLNIKINAENGNIITKSCTPAFGFRQKDNGNNHNIPQ